jgi:hypothetical protein
MTDKSALRLVHRTSRVSRNSDCCSALEWAHFAALQHDETLGKCQRFSCTVISRHTSKAPEILLGRQARASHFGATDDGSNSGVRGWG